MAHSSIARGNVHETAQRHSFHNPLCTYCMAESKLLDEAHELVEACELATEELRSLLCKRPSDGGDERRKRARSVESAPGDEDNSDSDSDSESDSGSESEEDEPETSAPTPSPIKFVLRERRVPQNDYQWIALFLRQRAEQGDPRAATLTLAANLIDPPS